VNPTAAVPSAVNPIAAAGMVEVVRLSVRFKERIAAVKSQIGEGEFAWYPNDSLGSFTAFDAILTGRFRSLLDNPGGRLALDIGCADGDVAFFLESLGFRVIAIDHPDTNFNRMRGIRKLKEALNSRVEIRSADIDSQFQLPEGQFDMVFLLGTLYHLKNPYYILDLLSRSARFCFLSTRVARFTPEGMEIRSCPVAYLLDPSELNQDSTNYWIFSEAGLRRLVRRAGWEVCDYGTIGDTQKSKPDNLQNDERAFCLVRNRRLTDPGFTACLLKGWHELEEGRWRWTERCFSVELPVPELRSDVALELWFTYPDYVKQRIESIRLNATIGHVALGEVQYSSCGEHVYRANVPAYLLSRRTAIVSFELDRAIPPDSVDLRERGFIVLSVGLY